MPVVGVHAIQKCCLGEVESVPDHGLAVSSSFCPAWRLQGRTADTRRSGGMAARYHSGYLVPGGVERSLTQKPWRPETSSPGYHPHPKPDQ
jgi:hypothetical protein